jgi:hypothetical protein
MIEPEPLNRDPNSGHKSGIGGVNTRPLRCQLSTLRALLLPSEKPRIGLQQPAREVMSVETEGYEPVHNRDSVIPEKVAASLPPYGQPTPRSWLKFPSQREGDDPCLDTCWSR